MPVDDERILAYLESLDKRVAAIEKSVSTINHELGVLSGSVKTTIVPTLVKYVIFPLIVIVGALVGVKLIF